jgi:hypothetical protein
VLGAVREEQRVLTARAAPAHEQAVQRTIVRWIALQDFQGAQHGGGDASTRRLERCW